MNQSEPESEAAASDTRLNFFERLPSPSWEQVSFVGSGHVWVWFKPSHVPHGLIISIPDEMRSAPELNEQLTMRNLLQAACVDPRSVAAWYLHGATYDAMNGTTPLLDQVVPGPMAGVDPNIIVYVTAPLAANASPAGAVPPVVGAGQFMNAPPVANMPPGAPPAHAPPADAVTPPVNDANVEDTFDHIEADWIASLQVENELSRLRKRLLDMSAKLKSLNRDLTSPERLHSDSQDKKDWTDARRFLRDAMKQMSMYVKRHDIGFTSAAGHRNSFEHTHKEFIAPRKNFPGLQQARRDFEGYRRTVVNLQSSMNNSLTNASQNAERRAQRILIRIAAKIREASKHKSFLGEMLD